MDAKTIPPSRTNSRREILIIAILTVDSLTTGYGDQPIVKDLTFDVNEGDFLVVIGDNGVGKTTLIRSLLGLLPIMSGTIDYADDLRIGYVPQFRNIDDEYPLSIRDFVALNLPQRPFPWITKKEHRAIERMLRLTNLTTIADRPLGLASGGEKQRAYLAQALLRNPKLLILDESTASLDNDMKYELLNVVARLQQSGLSVIFVTHDWELATEYGNRFLRLTPNGASTGPINELPKPTVEGAK